MFNNLSQDLIPIISQSLAHEELKKLLLVSKKNKEFILPLIEKRFSQYYDYDLFKDKLFLIHYFGSQLLERIKSDIQHCPDRYDQKVYDAIKQEFKERADELTKYQGSNNDSTPIPDIIHAINNACNNRLADTLIFKKINKSNFEEFFKKYLNNLGKPNPNIFKTVLYQLNKYKPNNTQAIKYIEDNDVMGIIKEKIESDQDYKEYNNIIYQIYPTLSKTTRSSVQISDYASLLNKQMIK